MSDRYDQLKKNIKTYEEMEEPNLLKATLGAGRNAIINLQEEIESLKAITELAIKEIDELREGLTSIINMDNPIKSAYIDRIHMIAKHTRTIANKIQIERLTK